MFEKGLTYCTAGVRLAAGHILMAFIVQDILDSNRNNRNCLVSI
jgi:hypothetical protein